MEHWELVARERIRDLVARYNANGDAGRFDAMLRTFRPDAVLELPDRTCKGVAEIRALLDEVAASSVAQRIRMQHHTATHQIDLESETAASGRAYYQVITPAGLDHWGRYLDEYVGKGDRWWIARRRVTVDGETPGGWSQRRASGL